MVTASHEPEQNCEPDIISLDSDHLDKAIVFAPVYLIIESDPDLDLSARSGLAEEVRIIEKHAFGELAMDGPLLRHRLCSIGAVALDVLNMILFILATPVADFDSIVVKTARELSKEPPRY